MTCALCGKTRQQCRRMVTGATGGAVCDQCIVQAMGIIANDIPTGVKLTVSVTPEPKVPSVAEEPEDPA